MGLDWQPTVAPRPGHEEEFDRVYRHFYEDVPIDVPVRKKFWFVRDYRAEAADRRAAHEAMAKRIDEIGILPEETLGSPRIGFDAEADAWWKERYEAGNKKIPFEETLQNVHGLYVAALAPRSDGLSSYSNGWFPGSYCEPYTFRGDFFKDFEKWLGQSLVFEAWKPHRPAALIDYGARLRAAAIDYARAEGIPLEDVEGRDGPELEYGTPPFEVNVVFSGARWCQWWGERNHGMIPWF